MNNIFTPFNSAYDAISAQAETRHRLSVHKDNPVVSVRITNDTCIIALQSGEYILSQLEGDGVRVVMADPNSLPGNLVGKAQQDQARPRTPHDISPLELLGTVPISLHQYRACAIISFKDRPGVLIAQIVDHSTCYISISEAL